MRTNSNQRQAAARLRNGGRTVFLLFLLFLFFFTGCGKKTDPVPSVTLLFEDHPDLQLSHPVLSVDKGSDLTVTVGIPAGQRIASVNYPGYQLSPRLNTSDSQNTYALTLPQVRYPAVIRVELEPDHTTIYRWGSSKEQTMSVTETSSRLRINSLAYFEALSREDAIAIGWRVQETGEILGFGSRFDHTVSNEMHLEAVYLPFTDAALFSYEIQENAAVITGFTPSMDHPFTELVLPSVFSGAPLKGIAAGAFPDLNLERLVLPPSLEWIEDGAFNSLTTEDLYLYDNLTSVKDETFHELVLTHLHLLAARSPVYCGSYFDTLSEKIDYLASVQDQPKLVLFCGSSARFGYNSPLLESYFPGRRVVNLGVYAYANMLPQARLMMHYLRPGDWVLSSPELDAIDTQFCGHRELDPETFAMMESNYDLFSLLDCREFVGIFDAFQAYQKARSTMEPREYTDLPSQYDEDGNRAASLVYNRQGDYILHRPSNLDGRLFGVKRAFYNAAHISEEDWSGLCSLYRDLEALGARVFFTYSPRSARSISPDSTPETIQDLEALFHEKLPVPILSDIQDSLMDAFYFYGTDNHLTTEGAELHTRKTAEDLLRVLEVTP